MNLSVLGERVNYRPRKFELKSTQRRKLSFLSMIQIWNCGNKIMRATGNIIRVRNHPMAKMMWSLLCHAIDGYGCCDIKEKELRMTLLIFSFVSSESSVLNVRI